LTAAKAAGRRTCAGCGGGFIGRVSARFCSPACKQKAYRTRRAPRKAVVSVLPSGHCAAAVALLAELDAELAESSAARGLLDPLEWTAAERATLENAAWTVDRLEDLRGAYRAADDAKVRVKISGELRLLETSLARLLKAVPTDLPAPKADRPAHAANARWRRAQK